MAHMGAEAQYIFLFFDGVKVEKSIDLKPSFSMTSKH